MLLFTNFCLILSAPDSNNLLNSKNMIRVGLADNQPVVHFGMKSFFKGHTTIQITNHFQNFSAVTEALKNKNLDVLIIDLELDGLMSINFVKQLIKDYPNTKFMVFSNLSEQIYTPNAIKAGFCAYVHKKSTLDQLEDAILKVVAGAVVYSDDVKRKLAFMAKQNKNDRLYRKLSSREIEVLRYLSDGKKNNEIAKMLVLNEKTISTYKLRLLNKLNVTNLVDLINKAKTLDIV